MEKHKRLDVKYLTMNYTQKYLLDLTPFVLYFVKYKYDEDDKPSKGTFLGYPAPSDLQQKKPYCLVFINSRNEKKFIHVYNDFYQITFPFLKQVRNFEKTTLLKILCKQEDIPFEIENIIINYCF